MPKPGYHSVTIKEETWINLQLYCMKHNISPDKLIEKAVKNG